MLKELHHVRTSWKVEPKFFKFVVYNLRLSSPSLTIFSLSSCRDFSAEVLLSRLLSSCNVLYRCYRFYQQSCYLIRSFHRFYQGFIFSALATRYLVFRTTFFSRVSSCPLTHTIPYRFSLTCDL